MYDQSSLVRRWYYDAGGAQCARCFSASLDQELRHGVCEKGNYRYLTVDSRENTVWLFCLEDVHSKKHARVYSSLAVRAYLDMRQTREALERGSLEAGAIAAHNIKNLNAQITSKVLGICDEDQLMKASDKVRYLADVAKKQPEATAKTILGVLRASKQMAAEFNVVDYMKDTVALQASEFADHKLHHLLVLAFYLYEQRFVDRHIFVRLPKTVERVRAHFATIQTVLYQIFDNAAKYCVADSEVLVSVQACLDGYVDVGFDMVSLCITDADLVGIGEIGFRGEHADRIAAPGGRGIGMAVVKRLVALNEGQFFVRRICNDLTSVDGVPYGRNEFVIRLRRGT